MVTLYFYFITETTGMKVTRHLLSDDAGHCCAFIRSPNHGGPLRPALVIIHYTAMDTCEAAVRRLADPASKVSAHIVIGRNGAITQLVPFNVVAWHAGQSRWKEYENLNNYAIGIGSAAACIIRDSWMR